MTVYSYLLSLAADTSTPTVRVNAPLAVEEDGFSPITTSHLYITDLEASADLLMIRIDTKPQYGRLVMEDDQLTGETKDVLAFSFVRRLLCKVGFLFDMPITCSINW